MAEPEQLQGKSFENLPGLQIVTPIITGENLRRLYTPDALSNLQAQRDNFDQSQKVILFNLVSKGLGDKIIALGTLVPLAKAYPEKEIVCVVSEPIGELLTKKAHLPANVRLVSDVTPDDFQSPQSTFYLFNALGDPAQYLDMYYFSNPKSHVFGKSSLLLDNDHVRDTFTNRISSLDGLFGPTIYRKDILPLLKTVGMLPPNLNLQHVRNAETILAFQLELLGVSTTTEDMYGALCDFSQEVLPPQDIDLTIIPDAHELEDAQANPPQSQKSFSLATWRGIFEEFAKRPPQTLGIVRGTSHLTYSDAVYRLATDILTKHGWKINQIRGSLTQVADALIRSRSITTMDTGPGHLGMALAGALEKVGRHISVQDFLRRDLFDYTSYGALGSGHTFVSYDSFDKIPPKVLVEYIS